MRIGCISNNEQCLPLLQLLKQSGHDVLLYIGKSHVNDGRREYVSQHCKTLNIANQKDEGSGTSMYSWIESIQPELVFVLGHISKIQLDHLPRGLKIYNIHFGKLPEYRGASPVFWQLKNGEPNIGCTIHEVEQTIDAGNIIWEKQIPFEEPFNWNYLHFLFSNLITDGVMNIVQEKMNGLTVAGFSQDETKARCFHQPALKDVLINWNTMTAVEICSLVRACDTWNNGAITLYNGMEVKIRDASEPEEILDTPGTPGTITQSDTVMAVRCANNTQLQVHYLAINDIAFAGRYACKYGFVKGQRFTYPSD